MTATLLAGGPPPATADQVGVPTAVWVDRQRTEVSFIGIGRSPDGSMVAATVRRRELDDAVLNRGSVSPSGTLQWRPVKGKRTRNPTQIVSTGETVFVDASGPSGPSNRSSLFRAKVPGEVAGDTTLVTRPRGLSSLVRLEATTIGTIGTRDSGRTSAEQVAIIDTTGLRWTGPKNADFFFGFDPAGTARTETGLLVDPNARVEWGYPGRPSPSTYGVEGDGPGNNGIRGATGAAGDIVFRDTTRGQLKVPRFDKGGGEVRESYADEHLVVFSPGGSAQTLPVPVPPDVDQACRDRALVKDARDIVLSDPWNGPGGDVWVVAGCGRGHADLLSVQPLGKEEPGPTEPDPIHTWLVRWTRGNYAATVLRLPLAPSGARSVDGRGFTGADGAMYVLSGAGTIAVRGLAPASVAPVASVSSVRRRSNGRVRVVVSCVGTVGDLCGGQVRIADRRGELATLPYAVEAGTAAMQPLVTREIAAKRKLRGKPTATLLP